jgi:hypothetical protein
MTGAPEAFSGNGASVPLPPASRLSHAGSRPHPVVGLRRPVEKLGRVYRGSRRDKIWTEGDIETAPPPLHLPLLWGCGLGNGRVTSCVSPGRPTTATLSN